MEAEAAFPDSWIDLRAGGPAEAEQRAALQTELEKEVGVGHVLRGRTFFVAAHSEANDDVLLALDGGSTWALIHLTWQPTREPSRWPTVTFFSTFADVVAGVLE